MAVKVLDFIMPNWADMIDADYKWERLHDACSCVVDCPHSTPKYDEEGGYFVARTQDIRTGCFDSRNAARVNRVTYEERIKRCQPVQGDILYSREGTYFGDAALIEHDNICLGQRMVLLRPDEDNYEPQYLVYWLNSIFMQRHLQGLRDGTVAERLNMSTIRSLPIARPPLEIQKTIAHILGALDDKIELNRRMNETLEAMAKALFKSWFVDFAPVKAKMEGRQPEGMDAETATLFPDKLVESELGLIPEGWEVGSLGSICKLLGGSAFKKDYQGQTTGDYPFIKVRDMNHDANHMFIHIADNWIDEKRRKIMKAKLHPAGATTFAKTGIALTYNRLRLLTRETAIDNNMMSATSKIQSISSEYLYLILSQIDLASHAKGSAVPYFNMSDLTKVLICTPRQDVQEAFSTSVVALFRRIRNNDLASISLTKLRDTLLPKLISGEIDIPALH